MEGDCVWQYLKLEKKIAAGADCAITQVGWDAEKFRELKRYLDERGLRTPLLGNVYVLGPRAAERMARGEPPGCWVSPALLETVRQEAQAKDGGLRARLERAARTVAVLRGLGYAGAYLGGTHDADHVAWIIRRARELGPRWEELAEELRYGRRGRLLPLRRQPAAPGPADPRRRTARSGPPRALGRPSRARSASPSRRTRRRRGAAASPACSTAWAGSSRSPETPRSGGRSPDWPPGPTGARPSPAPSRSVELAVKRPLFGCQACGNCVLGHLEYVCPETCPKHLRNGPCGGTLPRALRGRRPAVRVGRRPRARARRGPGARPPHLRPAARPHAPGHELLDQLPPRPRQPAPGLSRPRT